MQLIRQLPVSWKALLRKEMQKKYFKTLQHQLEEEKRNFTIYPQHKDIFRAFHLTAPEQTKVVILGQDPYHGKNQANGLAFSVNKDVPLPPSLRNIFKERQADLGIPLPNHGDLSAWARQGVLLLNAVLTVRQGEPASHKHLGWQFFTDFVIKTIAEQPHKTIFLLWGRHAASKKKLIDTSRSEVLEAAHPSPFSAYRGFLGCKHFSQTNDLLKQEGLHPVNWAN